MKEIKGDLIKFAKEFNFDIIAHGCNCFCTMGSGIAKTIKEEFPIAYEMDLKTIKGDINKLGNYTIAVQHTINNNFLVMIVNCYTQYRYDASSKPFDYEAFTLCMRKINHDYKGKIIGLPQIGAGLAGGNWNIIKKIIEKELKDMDVTIVYYKN
jgi:O-acetyl-ADP-ribose deacetylase (regulator of RNase III)